MKFDNHISIPELLDEYCELKDILDFSKNNLILI